MKYQVQVLSFTNFTVNADSEDEAREKVINTVEFRTYGE